MTKEGEHYAMVVHKRTGAKINLPKAFQVGEAELRIMSNFSETKAALRLQDVSEVLIKKLFAKDKVPLPSPMFFATKKSAESPAKSSMLDSPAPSRDRSRSPPTTEHSAAASGSVAETPPNPPLGTGGAA